MLHSTKVAEKHYLQVTDDHWRSAIQSRSSRGSPIKGDSDTISKNHENEKTPENIACDACWGFVMSPLE
jgi:hypothetical protein